MPGSENSRFVKRFVIAATLIVSLGVLGVSLGFHYRTKRIILDQSNGLAADRLQQAMAVQQLLSEESASNLSLIHAFNPHEVTSGLSGYFGGDSKFEFLVKGDGGEPKKTDGFLDDAFARFAAGASDHKSMWRFDGQPFLRHARPLKVDQSCLGCHDADDNFQVGQVRGSVSVAIPMQEALAQIQANQWVTGLLTLGILILLLAALYLLAWRLLRSLTAAEAKLMSLASVDSLTGVLNRRAIFSELDSELSRSHRLIYPLSCIMIDVDHFKMVNDTHGHSVGDTVLREVAQRVQRACRQYDTVGRYGGEEFLVLAPETTQRGAAQLAERIRLEFEKSPIRYNGSQLHVTASFGITATHQDQSERVEEFIGRADKALYQAKGAGRNQVMVAD